VVGGTPMKPAIVAVVPAPIPQQQTLAVSDEILPADAAAAIVGRSLDPARRSIVVVVDSAHALDAFAFATRFAKDDNAIEVTDVGQQLTSFSRERAGRRDMHAGAALAVVARGLAESSASSIQSELRRVDPVEGAAFEVTPVQTPLDFQQGLLTDAATTRPASAGQAGPATTQHAVTPTTAPVLDQAKPSDAAQLIDLYVVVRQATPETQPTSQPTTQPMH
jgi:hypothetical protein